METIETSVSDVWRLYADAYGLSEEMARERARQVLGWIGSRDVARLLDTLHLRNKVSGHVFYMATGLQKPRRVTLRSLHEAIREWVGDEAWDTHWETKEQERAGRKDTYARARDDSVLSQKVRHNGDVVTVGEYIRSIVADGYDSLEFRQAGATKRARLVNRREGRFYDLRRAAEWRLAERLICR